MQSINVVNFNIEIKPATLSVAWVVILTALSFMASVMFPLLTYSGGLALFGLAHVASEFRYVDDRFGQLIGKQLLTTLSILIAALMLLRLGGVTGVVDYKSAQILELLLGSVLIACTFSVCHKQLPLWLAVISSALLLLGLWLAPAMTFVVVAVLHNWTPVGFWLEAVQKKNVKRAQLACFILFVGLPLFIASGVPSHILASLGFWFPETSILPTGSLEAQLGVFVPSLMKGISAAYLFSAVTFAQCMHYIAVIYILPQLSKQKNAILPWPSRRTMWILVVMATLFLITGYVFNFGKARAVYGIFAVAHAWIEIPILILMLTPILKNKLPQQ